jgi:hypothetical protein
MNRAAYAPGGLQIFIGPRGGGPKTSRSPFLNLLVNTNGNTVHLVTD